jgi:hypothetical protein
MSRIVVARAAALVVLAVALGVILLNVGTRAPSGFSTTLAPPTSSTTTTTVARSHSSSTTTSTTAPLVRSAVKVLVANGSSVNGAAAGYASLLSHQGWGTLTPVTADAKVATTVIYYASGQQVGAADIASSLGLPPASVQALSASTPVAGTAGASVVVLLGADLASKAPGTTTTKAS